MERSTVLEILQRILRERSGERAIEINEQADLSRMGFDSLDISEIIVAIEEEFDCVIRMDDLMKLKSIGDFADLIMDQ